MGIYPEEVTKRLRNKLKEHPITGCLEWQGWRNEKGYGRIRVEGKDKFVHRVMMEIIQGKRLEPGEIVLHKCDNPRCCHEDHLVVGTLLENVQDMVDKRRKAHVRKKRRLNVVTVLQIRIALKYRSAYAVAAQFDVADSTIRDIKDYRTWKNAIPAPKPEFDFDPFADE